MPSPSCESAVLPARRWRTGGRLSLLGPAFVAAIAYVDPGNFATNIAGGAAFGYLLLWVILAANLMAMLIQYLSAKLGVVTGRDLPELCRERFPRAVTIGLWIQAELVAMATDLAEFVGAAIALNLLFGVPLFPAGLITAVVAFGLLGLQRRGHRGFERVIAGMGVHRPRGAADTPPPGDHGAGARRAGRRPGSDQGAHPEPGRALLRDSLRARPAGVSHPRHRDVMGSFANATVTTVAASVIAGLIILLNGFLLYQTLLG